MRNRAPRCRHGFYVGLCVVPGCTHFDGGAPTDQAVTMPEARPLPRSEKRTYRGASTAVRAVLLEMPDARNGEVARHCDCSESLVSQIRIELGLRQRRMPAR